MTQLTATCSSCRQADPLHVRPNSRLLDGRRTAKEYRRATLPVLHDFSILISVEGNTLVSTILFPVAEKYKSYFSCESPWTSKLGYDVRGINVFDILLVDVYFPYDFEVPFFTDTSTMIIFFYWEMQHIIHYSTTYTILHHKTRITRILFS